ncbi:hypothetical protein NC652_030389 [Populus alba x Populus x berolinensis]|nr:hypothetical protein NC652_030389 [Populus alba x Populus x berolinensis]
MCLTQWGISNAVLRLIERAVTVSIDGSNILECLSPSVILYFLVRSSG